jgi:ATP-dependent helicase/nuclease subunit B
LIARARALAAQGATVRVVVATRHQVHAWQRRLAEAGGALGVQVGTFDTLYRQVLRAAGKVYVRISDPVQYRLLRLLIADAPLEHYKPLQTKPGFVRVVLGLIRELKAGGVFEGQLLGAIDACGGPPRLRELAQLYQAYQERLREKEWADAAGIGWLAQEALHERPDLAVGWPCLLVDGFDDLTSVQLAVLHELSGQVDELLIALTGAPGRARPRAHRRFIRTRTRIQVQPGIQARPLPAPLAAPVPAAHGTRAPPMAHLEATLYERGEGKVENTGKAVSLIAATDREGEVRAALRWLKERLLVDGVPLRGAALLARSMDSYRPHVEQAAAEYGVPVVFASGTPLRANPAVAALLDLIRLAVSGADGAFPWRQTVETWRSPYLRWIAEAPGLEAKTDPEAGRAPDAGALDRVARWGSVIGGLEQWREALDRLVESLATAGTREEREEELAQAAQIVPDAAAAEALRAQFERFVAQVTPPEGAFPCRVFVTWIEALVGDEMSNDEEQPGVLHAVRSGPPELVERDRAALIALKDVLRGLVWADEALGCKPASFATFLEDLTGAVNTATFRLPLPADREALLVADVTQARGVVYDAVAVLGLAEGEFPTALSEDPFLRDADRRRLRDEFGLEVDLSTASAEGAYFYEAITRAYRSLLLTRPRIADNGAPWQASPYWDEVKRRVAVEPVKLSSTHAVPPTQAASWPELLRTCGAYSGVDAHTGVRARTAAAPHGAALWAWASALDADRLAGLASAASVLAHRTGDTPTPYDGGLAQWSGTFAERFGPQHTWSASRLESYRACPFFFYVGSVLRLEPRAVPAEGLDARQTGNLYHHILEGVYKAPAVDDPTDLAQLLAALPGVATPLLDAAPRQEGFRETAWWDQTRDEIIEDVRDSLRALNQLRGEYAPASYEQAFGLKGQPPLVVCDAETGDELRVRGYIDRVDRAPDGRVRIIDYKTGGYSGFTARAFREGKKLQLALYACAAQSLGLGEVADGYYWHVRQSAWHLEHAQSASWFSLARVGPQKVIDTALAYSWQAVRAVRAGEFAPKAPEDGCPDYCPAAGFCWHYEPRGW